MDPARTPSVSVATTPDRDCGHTPAVSLGDVLVVEDERFTRMMLATVIEALGFRVCGVATTAPMALAAMERDPVDVAILDLDLGPGPSGIDVAYALRARDADIGLVFLTSFSDPRIKDSRERPLPAGARYLVKSQLDDVEALRTALLDARRHPTRASAGVVGEPELTAHQMAVLREVATGRTNGEIARMLGVSDKAVERTVQRTADALAIGRSAGNLRVLLTRAYAQLSGKPLPGA